MRTIRFYISQQLVPGPHGRGTSAVYTDEHFQRLLLIRHLAGRHLPLNEIRDRLERVSTQELSQMLEQERLLESQEKMEMSSSPREYLSTLLEGARLQRQGAAQGVRAGPPGSQGTVYGVIGSPMPHGGDRWRRVKIAHGIEIHISEEAEQKSAGLVAELIDLSRQAAHRERRRKGT